MSEKNRSEVLSAINMAVNLRRLRREKKLKREEISRRAGISPSYYSELETGKTPSISTLHSLSDVLKVPVTELWSNTYDAVLEPLLDFSDMDTAIKEGIELLDKAPHLAKAIPKLLANMPRTPDMGDRKEITYPILLRNEQEEHKNNFCDIENEASDFLKKYPPKGVCPSYGDLLGVLKYDLKYDVKHYDFKENNYPSLPIIRSMWIRKDSQIYLLLNKNLLRRQMAFEIAKEIAYNLPFLKDKETFDHRSPTSPRVMINSYTQILNEFKASYFAGAVLIPKELLENDIEEFFNQETFQKERLQAMMARYQVTPEMLLHRLSEILPASKFRIEKLHFMRFQHDRKVEKEKRAFSLTKYLNLNSLRFNYVESSSEKYCRRYSAIKSLRDMRNYLKEIEENFEPEEVGKNIQELHTKPSIRAQRSRIINAEYHDSMYLCITIARPLKLQPNILSSVTLGFVIDEHLKNTVHFWNDRMHIEPKGHEAVEVGHTCQRCPLPLEGEGKCSDRAVEPVIFREKLRLKELEQMKNEAEREILS